MAISSDLPSADERALATSALAGDEEALGNLLALNQQSAYNVAYRLLGSDADARDAVQEAFLQTVRAVRGDGEPPREVDRFKAWLRRVVANAALGQLRRRPSFRPLPVDDVAEVLHGPEHGEPARQAERREVRGNVLRALLALPDSQRAALTLREYEELPYERIAEQLGVTRPAVERLLFRARQGFRAAYEGLSAADEPVGCAELGPRLASVVDGEADPSAWREIEDHLKDCPRCRRELDGLRKTRRMYALIPLLAAPAGWDPARAAIAAASTGGSTEVDSAREAVAGLSDATAGQAAATSQAASTAHAAAVVGATAPATATAGAVAGAHVASTGILANLAAVGGAKAVALLAAAGIGVATVAAPMVLNRDAPAQAGSGGGSPSLSAPASAGASPGPTVGSPNVAAPAPVGASPVPAAPPAGTSDPSTTPAATPNAAVFGAGDVSTPGTAPSPAPSGPSGPTGSPAAVGSPSAAPPLGTGAAPAASPTPAAVPAGTPAVVSPTSAPPLATPGSAASPAPPLASPAPSPSR